jgi:NTE family protein
VIVYDTQYAMADRDENLKLGVRSTAILFGDLDRGTGPLILASATDISTGSRFTFSQAIFDVICSDLNAVPLSRAAAASSAVPVVLSPITISNYGGTCNSTPPAWAKPFIGSDNPPRPAARAIRSFRADAAFGDGVHRPCLHPSTVAYPTIRGCEPLDALKS